MSLPRLPLGLADGATVNVHHPGLVVPGSTLAGEVPIPAADVPAVPDGPPSVIVNVPEQAPPVVNVPEPKPRIRRTRFERDERGEVIGAVTIDELPTT